MSEGNITPPEWSEARHARRRVDLSGHADPKSTSPIGGRIETPADTGDDIGYHSIGTLTGIREMPVECNVIASLVDTRGQDLGSAQVHAQRQCVTNHHPPLRDPSMVRLQCQTCGPFFGQRRRQSMGLFAMEWGVEATKEERRGSGSV